MAATKTLRTIIAAGTTNSAGATTTGTAVDLTTAYGGVLTAKITNGATGPTVGAALYVMISGDNSTWKEYLHVASDTTANSVNEWAIEIPPGVMHVRADVKDNTVQSVTCEAFLHELTTI